MALFVFGLLFVVGLLGCLAVAPVVKTRTSMDTPARAITIGAGVASGFLGLILILVSMFNTVHAREIGVVTEWGKVTGRVGPGAHLLAPWATITTIDGTIQTDSYRGANCITVRIAHQQTACVNATIRWRVEPAAVDSLYKNYRTFAHIRESLVTRELDVALNQQFANYDPIASLVSKYAEGTKQNPTVIQLSTNVLSQMQGDLKGQASVLSVLIPSLSYDSSVQSRINSVLAQTAQTDIALQAEKTAQAQSTANKLLAGSVSHDPNVLIARCEDITVEAMKSNYQLPPTWNCLGSNSGILVNGHP